MQDFSVGEPGGQLVKKEKESGLEKFREIFTNLLKLLKIIEKFLLKRIFLNEIVTVLTRFETNKILHT